MPHPERPWIVFGDAVRAMVETPLRAAQDAIAARADESDRKIERLTTDLGELAEIQRQATKRLDELSRRPEAAPSRADGSFAPLYDFNDWLAKAMVALEQNTHRYAAENEELRTRLSRIESSLESSLRPRPEARRPQPSWLLGAALPAVVVMLAVVAYLVR